MEYSTLPAHKFPDSIQDLLIGNAINMEYSSMSIYNDTKNNIVYINIILSMQGIEHFFGKGVVVSKALFESELLEVFLFKLIDRIIDREIERNRRIVEQTPTIDQTIARCKFCSRILDK